MAHPKHNWDQVDWSKRNCDIARDLNVSSVSVCLQRQKRTGKEKRSSGEMRDFPLIRLRTLKINPLVRVGQETVFVSSLKNRKGEEIVKVEKAAFMAAMAEKAAAIWSED